MIPKRIIQTCIDQEHLEMFLEKRMPQSFSKNNLGYEHIIYTNYDQEKFMQDNFPEYFLAYQSLPMKVCRSDLFRLCEIYLNGGFYFDLDVECLNSLDDLTENTLVFPIEEIITQSIFQDEFALGRYVDSECTGSTFTKYAQYAFAAQPKHKFIKQAIQDIVDNVDRINADYQKVLVSAEPNYEYFVYNATATDRITYSVHRHCPTDLTKMYHLGMAVRDTPDWTYPLYFGKYAVHWCKGIWKSNKTR